MKQYIFYSNFRPKATFKRGNKECGQNRYYTYIYIKSILCNGGTGNRETGNRGTENDGDYWGKWGITGNIGGWGNKDVV